MGINMISQRVRDISYANCEIVALESEVTKIGKIIYHPNIGDLGIYDFQTS